MLQKSLEKRLQRGGGIKKDKSPPRAAPLSPQIFMHGDFFENKSTGKTEHYGKSTQTAGLP